MSTQSSFSYEPPEIGNYALDAFGRQRVSQPFTQWSSKLIGDARPLFWDDQEVSGGGTSSNYQINTSSVIIGVSDGVAGKRVRQTKQRFDYLTAKSHQIFVTGTFRELADGITREMVYFDGKNGIFLRINDSEIKLVKRSYVTGSMVDTEYAKVDWSLYPEVYMAPEKSIILTMDFEWLGVGSIRFGFVNNGIPEYVHQVNHANIESGVYMTTPNLPIRYSIENDGNGPDATMECICSSVSSEGGADLVGGTRMLFNATHVDANAAGTTYAIIGYRLKPTHLDNVVKILTASVANVQSGGFRWGLYLNPSVGDTFTYNDVANTPVQVAYGATANTITGGTPVYGDVVYAGGGNAGGNGRSSITDLLYVGSFIDGTPDTMVLGVTPLSANEDIYGTLNLSFS